MKKLLLIICILLIVGGCTLDYKDIKPKEAIAGTVVQIDSAQWTSVLMQIEENNTILVLDKDGIKEIQLINPIVYLIITILAAALFLVLIVHLST